MGLSTSGIGLRAGVSTVPVDIMSMSSFAPASSSASDQVQQVAGNMVEAISGKSFTLPTVEAPQVDAVSQVNADTTDVTQSLSRNQAVQQDYIDTNALIVAEIHNVMRDVVGPETADSVMGALIPRSSPGMVQATATVADPTGALGGLYSALSTIYAEANGPENAEINDAISRTLSRIQEISEAQREGRIHESGRIITPGHDYSNVQPEHLRAFLERNPLNDPIMLQARTQETGLQAIQRNNGVIETQYDVTGDLAAKATAAAAAGDMQGAETLAPDETIEIALQTGLDENEVVASQKAVSETLGEGALSGVTGLELASLSLTTAEEEARRRAAAAVYEVPPPQQQQTLSV